ncbi:NUDIX hydrolase [Arthrospiribacter ruber]|uniref:NUDIX hydrolase n=1 Tax=Arthrospiribacter ruber TaxID=2487934 RepID=A0A951IWX5_9BACT|nr:NUDIX hydrolase [Arthrospiribacter ruber]MBW3467033.1 NUDIX hydrolase [Arthrospiribacter ruber]
MKIITRVALFFSIFLFSQTLIAQEKNDNYSFFKLYVTNDKDEVLLVKWNNEWEIAGDRYNDPLSVNAFLDKMASDMGIRIKDPKLCGMYTQRWKNSTSLTLMQYYQAKYDGGDLKVPEDCSDIKWFGFEEALDVIPYENMTRIMKEIKKHPGKVIGAAFERYRDENNNTQFITLEDWHIMN